MPAILPEQPMPRRLLLPLPILAALAACDEGAPPPKRTEAPAHEKLAAHSAEFRPDVINVAPGIHVAVGYGLANSILIEGENGVIVVDTLESVDAARRVKAEFDRITRKPVKAVVYTHYHSDHVNGAAVFAGEGSPEIISHAETDHQIDLLLGLTAPAIYTRSMRQFGALLPKGMVVNDGIGPHLDFTRDTAIGLLRPTRTFTGDTTMTIAGVTLQFVHAPGETEDQIFVWLPERKVLLAADNFYKSFPNLYTIRGTAYRDLRLWVASLDRMRELGAEFMIPSHTRPVAGADEIRRRLTNYRDAIQFVHDQTVRLMNQGLTPDQIVEKIKLPPHLAEDPWLQEFYGTIAWSVRSVFTGYLGWYSGASRDMFPAAPATRAARIVELAGGTGPALERASAADAAGDPQWALELADQVLTLEPANERARTIKAAALEALAGRQISANARNYLLAEALEARGELSIPPIERSKIDATLVAQTPLKVLFANMAVNLDPARSADTDRAVRFRFPDTNEVFTVHVRRGVAEVQPRDTGRAEATVIAESGVWKEVVFERRSLPLALVAGDVKVEGSTLDLIGFLRLFKSG